MFVCTGTDFQTLSSIINRGLLANVNAEGGGLFKIQACKDKYCDG